MNWIRQQKRLAIYLRDGLACVYCGASIEEGVQLSLDHVKAHSKGGSNSESNLITACSRCNSSRGDRSARRFAVAAALYVNRGVTAEGIMANIRRQTRLSLGKHLIEAGNLIKRRGSAARVLSVFQSPLAVDDHDDETNALASKCVSSRRQGRTGRVDAAEVRENKIPVTDGASLQVSPTH